MEARGRNIICKRQFPSLFNQISLNFVMRTLRPVEILPKYTEQISAYRTKCRYYRPEVDKSLLSFDDSKS